MEFSIKTISHFLEPIVAFFMPFILVGVDFSSFFEKNNLTIEEKSRILMAVMFSIFYFVRTIRKYELKDELTSIKSRLDKLEKSTQPASASDV